MFSQRLKGGDLEPQEYELIWNGSGYRNYWEARLDKS